MIQFSQNVAKKPPNVNVVLKSVSKHHYTADHRAKELMCRCNIYTHFYPFKSLLSFQIEELGHSIRILRNFEAIQKDYFFEAITSFNLRSSLFQVEMKIPRLKAEASTIYYICTCAGSCQLPWFYANFLCYRD
ncbi:hypothetical protein S83_023804 [Arachis hypogaea]